MAETPSIEQPIPLDDIIKGNTPAPTDKPPRGGVTKTAPSISEPIPFDQVFAQFQKDNADKEKAAAPKPDKGIVERIGDNFRTAEISDSNKRLGDIQFTSQTPDKDSLVAPAIHGPDLNGDEKDDSYYFKTKDESGKEYYQQADKNKHVVFRDPDSGEYNIYNRDKDQDRGAISGRLIGLGHFVQEGFNAGAPTRLPSTVTSLTKGQEALNAANTIRETTGTRVPVPQNMVTESKVAPVLAHTAEAIPGGGAPFEQAAAGFEHGVEGATNRAAGINTSNAAPTAEAAGQTARGAIEDYAKPKDGVLAQRVSDAYDKVDALVSPEAKHDLANTRAVAQDLQTRYEATGQEGFNPTIQKVLGAATHPEGVTYQGLKDLRSQVGEMLEGGTKISETGVSDKELRGLYKGLTDDMRDLVGSQGGPRATQLWNRANNYAKLASQRREQLGKILGANRSDEGIFGSILTKAGSTNSADANTLALAKKSMPADEWNEIASAAVGRLGRTKGTGGDTFDVGKFVSDYSKLSDRGKSILFGDNQRLRKALDAINDLAQYNEPVRHPGPIAHLISAGAVLGHAGGAEGVVGKMGQVLHVLGAVTGVRVLGRMLSKPATAESVAKWMQSYKIMTLKPTKGSVTLFQRASQGLANNAAQEDRENIGAAASTGVDILKKLVTLVSPMGR